MLLVNLAEGHAAGIIAALASDAALGQRLHQPLKHRARGLGWGGRPDGDLQIQPLRAAVGVHHVAAPYEVKLKDREVALEEGRQLGPAAVRAILCCHVQRACILRPATFHKKLRGIYPLIPMGLAASGKGSV